MLWSGDMLSDKRSPHILVVFILSFAMAASAQTVLVEAESFQSKGGWQVDQQFMDQMGSPFLLAHGMGRPVEDAVTRVELPSAGDYYVHVRTWDWCSPWQTSDSPGRFQILINGRPVPRVFGTKGSRWGWVKAGPVHVASKSVELKLHDLTGFDGRCDAIVLTADSAFTPPNEGEPLHLFRKRLLDRALVTPEAGRFDLVVVGGGVAGMSAAISAARLGLQVALVQDRPVLGGNNSSEIGVYMSGDLNQAPYRAIGNVVREIKAVQMKPEKSLALVRAESNLKLFLNVHVFDVQTEGSRIAAVIGKHIETGRELRFVAPLFADCTGDGTVGFLAGADCRMGRETRSETAETLAPEVSDDLSYGSTLSWYSEDTGQPSAFPECPWALQFTEQTCQNATRWGWNWETGFHYDQIDDFEYVRDYMLRVIYGNWAFQKNHAKDKAKYASRRLARVGYVAGKRESRRLLGDVILRQQDIEGQTPWPDAAVTATYSIDQHFPHPENTAYFPNEEFRSIQKHNHNAIGLSRSVLSPEKLNGPFQIPYRCLYSRNIENLFMAGRNISVTRIALTAVRVQGTTGMMGEVVGIAASLCAEHETTPRGIYDKHLTQLTKRFGHGVPTSQ
jgi:FAD dependent oxidoreductase